MYANSGYHKIRGRQAERESGCNCGRELADGDNFCPKCGTKAKG
ncbi:MAG: zinc ribbon domain-containing protein [Synergistaceae bacterium]|nr:zinc ribbon domain-containing protein [Synergistaceae bacterium]